MANIKGKPIKNSSGDREWQIGDSSAGITDADYQNIIKKTAESRSGSEQSVLNDMRAMGESDRPIDSGAQEQYYKDTLLSDRKQSDRVLSDQEAGYEQAALDEFMDSDINLDDKAQTDEFIRTSDPKKIQALQNGLEDDSLKKFDEALDRAGWSPSIENEPRQPPGSDGFTSGPSGNRGPASFIDSIIPNAGAADETPMGAQQIAALKKGGLSPLKLKQWKADAEAAMAAGGMPEDEIREFFGEPKFDEAPVKEYFKSNPDWHAPLANAPAYTGKDKAPETKKPPKEAKGLQEAFGAGFKQTGVGMLSYGGTSDTVLGEKATIMERLAEGAGQIAGDAAPMAGATALTLLALPAAGAAGVAGIAAAGAGMFMGGAAPAGLRKLLVDKYTKGEVKSAQEFWDRAQETLASMGEGGIINALTMGAGAGAGKLAGKAVANKAISEVAKTGIKTGSALTAEVATMGSVPKLLNGELPELEDFGHATAVILGMHAIGAGVTKTTGVAFSRRADAIEARLSAKVDAKVKTAYAETGLTPPEVTEMARRDPVLAQELMADKPGLPESLEPYKDVNGRSDFPEAPKAEVTEVIPDEFGGGEVTTKFELPSEKPAAMGAEPPVTPEGTVKPELPPESTASKELSPREAFKNATPEKQAEISAEASFNFVKSGIGEAPVDGVVKKTKRFLTEGGLREHIINKYDPVTQFVREVTGAKSQQGAIDAMPASESAVLLTGLFNGQVGKALRAIESDTISYKTGETTGEGLIPILKVVEQTKLQKLKNKIPGLKDSEYRPTAEDFDAYVFAKHAKEVAEKYDHVTGLEKNAAATNKVIEIGDRIYKDAAKRFVDFQNRGLKYLADSGLKSKDEYAKMVSKYEHYITLEKIIVGEGPGSISKSLNPKQILKKRGKGSAEQIYSPTLRTAERIHEYYTMAEKNRVTKSIHDMMVKYDYPVKEIKADPGFKMEIMDENGKPTGEFASVYRELKNNELAFFEEGVRKVFDVPENVANTIKAMGIDKTNQLTNVLAIPAKLLRLGVTIPIDFMLKNMFRDQFHAFTQSRGNYIPYVTYLEGLANIAAKSNKYRDYQSFGAMNSSSVSLDINYSGKSLARIADKTSMRDAAFNVVSSPIKAMQVGIEMLQKLSDLAESGTRVGEYSRVYEKGRRQGLSHQDAGLKAAFAARNVTVDFQRMGASMKAFNMVVPFLNPNIQGTAQIFTNIQERRYDVALKMGALTAAAAGLWALNKDDPRMKEIPQWQKDMFYIIPMDEWVPSIEAEIGNPNTRLNDDGTYETNIGKIIRLPKPQGMIAGSSQSVEAYLDYLHSQDPDKGEVLRKEILKAFMPDTPINPTAFSVPMQLRTNYDTFRDKQLVPWYLEASRLPHRRYTKATSSAAKFLSQKMFELGVETDFIPAPAKTDFAVTGILGSTGRTILDVTGMALDKMAGRPVALAQNEWDDMPFVRSFTIRMPEQSEAVNSYYNLKKEHDVWVKDTSAADKAGDKEWMNQNQTRKEYLVMNEMKADFAKADGLMKAIKEQIEQVESMPDEKMSKTEKSRTIDAYMWTRIKVARELIQKNKQVVHDVDSYWNRRSK